MLPPVTAIRLCAVDVVLIRLPSWLPISETGSARMRVDRVWTLVYDLGSIVDFSSAIVGCD